MPCRHVPVERVVLNALANSPAALPPNLLSAPLAIDLPSVRAGLAFSGEVDPPARATKDSGADVAMGESLVWEWVAELRSV